MSVSDVLQILSDGRPVRGSIELDDRLLMWTARFSLPRTLTIDFDEEGYDEPIPFDLVEPDSGLGLPESLLQVSGAL